MTLSKTNVTLGILTGIVMVSTLGSKKLYTYCKKLKKSEQRWQGLYYDKLTQDDVAWG